MDNQELDTTAYQVGINHRQYIGQGMVDVLLYYQQGIPTLGAKAGWEDDIEDGATTKYKMLGWNLYYGTNRITTGYELIDEKSEELIGIIYG